MIITKNDLGNVLSSIFSANQKEVKLEITCKVVHPEENRSEDEKPTNSTSLVYNEENIPRPLCTNGRINGIMALADFLGCSVSTAQKLKNENKVPYYARGSRIYFYKDEIADSMKQSPIRNNK